MPDHLHLLWKISDGFKRMFRVHCLVLPLMNLKKYLKKSDPFLLESISKLIRYKLPVLGKRTNRKRVPDEEILSAKITIQSRMI